MTQFQLWDLPTNFYCKKIENLSTDTEKLKKELKVTNPEIFSGGLGRFTKIMAKFEFQDNVNPVFKKKRNVLFTPLEQINEELDRLIKTGVLSKLEYSEWVAPTVYMKKKSKDIRVCVDFSTGLNAALKDFNYPLPCPEDMFAKLNGGNFFRKLTLVTSICKFWLKR